MRQSRAKLRARAIRAAESWANDPKNHKDAVVRSTLSWLAGYEAHRRDARKPLKVSDIVTVDIGPLSAAGKALDAHGMLLCGTPEGAVLTIPALGSRPRHRAETCVHGYRWQDLADGTSSCPGDDQCYPRGGRRTPREIKPGDYVKLLVVRKEFQVALKVGDIGRVEPNHGGSLLKVRWFEGDMWIKHEDVALVS